MLVFKASSASARSYFDMSESFSGDISHFPKWTGMIDRFDTQKSISLNECGKIKYHPCSIKNWKNFIEQSGGAPFETMLDKVNRYGNQHTYITDKANWGVLDYWETPHEFFSVFGDCEDYAITKYYSLKALGIPVSSMRIIIVQDFNLGGVIHAVLGVYHDDELYLLDNQIKQVIPASRVYHYKPIYGINEEGWWAYYPKVG